MDVEGSTSPLAELLFGERDAWGRMQRQIYGNSWQTLDGDETEVQSRKRDWLAMRAVCRKAGARLRRVFWYHIQNAEYRLCWSNSVLNAVDEWQDSLSQVIAVRRTNRTITFHFRDPADADDFLTDVRELGIVYSGAALY